MVHKIALLRVVLERGPKIVGTQRPSRLSSNHWIVAGLAESQ